MSGPELRFRLRPRCLPWGLLGMLALVVLVEMFAKRHESGRFLKVDAWSWKQTARQAERAAATARVVCLGDSLVQVGIAAPVVEKLTGRSTENLAISGGQAVSSFFLLRRVLESGGRPEALIVDFFPRHLMTSPLLGLDPWVSLAEGGEVLELAAAGRDPEFLGKVALAKLLPSLRARPEIRSNVMAALNGEDQVDRHHVPPFLRRNRTVNRGGLLCPPAAIDLNDLESWTKTYFPADWSCHPIHAAYIRRFLALAGEHQIPVFWVLPPHHPALQERCEHSGFDRRHLEFVRGFQADDPNLTVIDGRHAAYDPQVFFDPHHLARDGAAVFSFDVAVTVRHALESAPQPPRWIELPAYRARPIDGPLEDVEQSRIAVKQERTTRYH